PRGPWFEARSTRKSRRAKPSSSPNQISFRSPNPLQTPRGFLARTTEKDYASRGSLLGVCTVPANGQSLRTGHSGNRSYETTGLHGNGTGRLTSNDGKVAAVACVGRGRKEVARQRPSTC